MKIKPILTLSFLLVCCCSFSQSSLTQVYGFGNNPGNLNMYTYIPTGISDSSPLVISMHGCGQTAAIYAAQSGWNKLADLHHFYVVYPEQQLVNNGSNCFNWFQSADINKDQGEALSIRQMVDYMISNYSINPSAIFVTGLSAGAGMSVVMLADYPEIFSKGAIMAGVPYKAATSGLYASTVLNGGVSYPPNQWGDSVRAQNPNYTGTPPRMAIFHGTYDLVVNVANATELIKQWTNVNNADQTIDSTFSSYLGNSSVEKTVYTDASNATVVEYFKISGMGHGISLDTGSCPRQGGAVGYYAIEENFHSTYWAANFFNILRSPYIINGLTQVIVSSSNVIYSVPFTIGSSYAWTVPTGASITNGLGTNSITVTFGSSGGDISVQETTSSNCVNESASLHVNVDVASSISAGVKTSSTFFYSKTDNSIVAKNINLNELKALKLFNSLGQKLDDVYSIQGNKIVFSSDLKAGVYIVLVETYDKQYSSKIVVY
jgi:poly(hydroxyalkanoate) depolymerase family esterase